MTTTIMLPTWDLDGITFNAVDDDGVEWIVEEDEGWDTAPGPRLALVNRVVGDGSYDSDTWLEPRTIILTGYLLAPTRQAADGALRRLAMLGSSRTRSTLTVTDPTQALTASVRLAKKTDGKRINPNCAAFQVSLIAPDPRKFSADFRELSTGLATAASGGVLWDGVPWNNPAASVLNQNPGFESGTTGWQGVGGSLAVDTAVKYSGTQSIKITPTGTNSSPRVEGNGSVGNRVAVTPGKTYQVSARINSATGWASGGTAVINWLDAGGVYLSNSISSTPIATPANTWVQAVLNVVAPAGAAFGTARAQLNGTPAATDVYNVDDLEIREVSGLVLQSARGNTGIVTLTNAGTAPAPIEFVLTDPAEDILTPAITDTSMGRVISYGGTVTKGSSLAIDTETGSVLLDGANRGALLQRSEFFTIPPRSSIDVLFSAGGSAPSASLLARWRDTYI